MNVGKIATAGALSIALLGFGAASQLMPANASYAIENQQTTEATATTMDAKLVEGTCEKQEVVYASMTATGAVKHLYVVNELFAEVPTMVKDFGTYSEVVNLTDDSDLAREPDSVLALVQDESFAYQGNLASTDLPWKVDIAYELDGTPIAPAELTGRSGDLKIVINTTQNHAVDPLYFDNYLLQITCTLPMDHAANVATEEGAIALAGSDTTVTFSGMPGKEGTYELTAKVQDFQMEGMSIAAIPFSTVIEMPDSDALISQFDALIEGTDQLDAGANGLKEGTAALKEGAAQFEGGTTELQNGTQELSAGVAAYSAGIARVSEGLAQAAAGSQTFADKLTELSQASAGIAQALTQTQTQMQQLARAISESPTMSQAEKDAILAQLAGTTGQFDQLQTYVSGVGSLAEGYAPLNDSLAQLSAGASELSQQGTQLTEGSERLDAGMSELANSTADLAQGTSELDAGASALAEGTATLHEESASIPDKVQAEIDAMMADYDKSDFTPQSFTDARNTNVTLVQFVMATEAISVPEEPATEEQETEESLLSRFFALFS